MLDFIRDTLPWYGITDLHGSAACIRTLLKDDYLESILSITPDDRYHSAVLDFLGYVKTGVCTFSTDHGSLGMAILSRFIKVFSSHKEDIPIMMAMGPIFFPSRSMSYEEDIEKEDIRYFMNDFIVFDSIEDTFSTKYVSFRLENNI